MSPISRTTTGDIESDNNDCAVPQPCVPSRRRLRTGGHIHDETSARIPANSDEIQKYIESEITPLLSTTSGEMNRAKHFKTRHDLEIECMHCIVADADALYNTCRCIKRIKIILNAYHRWMHHRTRYPHLSTIKALTFSDIYTFTDIYNDFVHIKEHMNYSLITQNKLRRAFRQALPHPLCHYSRHISQETYDQMTTEDAVFEQEFHKMYSFLTHPIVQPNIPPLASKKPTTDDTRWWTNGLDNCDDDWKEDNIHDDKIYSQLTQNMGVFRWQNRYGFTSSEHHSIMHLRPLYHNIKDEVLQNPYHTIPKDVWNQTLRKSTLFYESFARKRIRTHFKESYCDAITQDTFKWNSGEVIRMHDIVTIKLYTDFDELQCELKKCLRFDTMHNIFALNNFDPSAQNEICDPNAQTIRYELEQRLRAFYWWRSTLLMVLHKYASRLDGAKTLYHGVNAQMILNNGGTQSLAFCGPLSTSASYHVARTFATPKGMVLEVTTQFPRMGMCRVFDVSVLSEYPEEQEWLLSFAYLRITSVHTRALPGMESVNNDGHVDYTHDMVPLASKTRSIFFALQLFRHQFFCMSVHLEYWLTAFLYLQCGKDDECMVKTTFMESLQRIVQSGDYGVDGDLNRYHQILNMLWNKFENFRKFPNREQVVKLDTISDGLKPYFMDNENDNSYGVSFSKIVRIFENVKEIHFINQYKLDNVALNKLILYLDAHTDCKMKTIKFLYYNYDGPMCNCPNDSTIFHDPETLDGGLRKKLEEMSWNIKYRNIRNIGYQIVLNSN
eukprot:493436_1